MALNDVKTLLVTTALAEPLSGKADLSALKPVALSGAYADLTGKPVLGTAAAANVEDFAPTAALAGKASVASVDDLSARTNVVEVLVPQSPSRAGEARALFSSALTGDPLARPIIEAGTVVTDSVGGTVLRIGPDDVPGDPGWRDIAPRVASPLYPDRTYLVRGILRRSTDPIDPENNAIELRWQNLNGNKNSVSNVRLGDALAPSVAEGIVQYAFLVGKEGAPGTLDYTVPPSAVYGLPHIRVYGNGQATDIIDIPLIKDVTDMVNTVAGLDSLGAALAAEIMRAVAAENVLTADLSEEQAARIAADALQATNLTAESTIRAARDNAIASKASVIPLVSPTGTNDITATPAAEFTEVPVVNGTFFKFQASATNTGPMTLNGLPLLDQDGNAMAAGMIRSPRWYEVRYSDFSGGRYSLVSGDITMGDVKTITARSATTVATLMDRNAIASPVTGAHVYVVESDRWYQWSGSAWVAAPTANAIASKASVIPLVSPTGTNDITATPAAEFTEVPVVNGTFFKFQASATNTGPMTLNGLPLLDQDGNAMAAGMIRSPRWYEVRYSTFSGGRYLLVSGDITLGDVVVRDNALRGIVRELADMAGVYSPIIPLLDRVGAWYDFTDRRTLWQDRARTVRVNAAMQPIGYVDDKSGRGYDYNAVTDAARPGYRTDTGAVAAAAWFDVGQYLAGRRRDLTRAADKLTVFALVAYDRRSAAENRCIISHSNNVSPTSARAQLSIVNNRGRGTVRQADSDPVTLTHGFVGVGRNYDVDAWMVLEQQFDFAGGKTVLYSNGNNSPEGRELLPTSANATDMDENASWIGGFSPTLNNYVGYIAQIVEVRGELDDDDRAAMYDYFKSVAPTLSVGDLAEYDPTGPLPVVFFAFNYPNVLRLAGAVERYAVGGVSSGGSTMVADYRFDGADPTISHTVLYPRLETDDHNIPVFNQLSDGNLIAVYCKHNADPSMFMQKTITPGDLENWTAPVDIGAQTIVEPGHEVVISYDLLVRLSGESDRLYLIYRETDLTVSGGPPGFTGQYWVMTWSDDDGETWTHAKRMWGPMRPYTRVASNGVDRIDFFFNDSHPTLDAKNDIHHCYYKSGALYRSDDTLITTMVDLPAVGINRFTDPTLVYDVEAHGEGNSWVADISYDPDTSRPVGAYAAFVGTFVQGDPYVTTDLERIDYYQTRWTGSAWTRHKICEVAATGMTESQPYYTGGVITDPQNVDTVYCSRAVDGVWQIFKYVTADGGATWSGTQLTFGDKAAFRPVIAANSRRLFYVTGDYGPTYTHYHTHVEWLDIS